MTEQERQAALDALDILVAHCVLDDNFCNELKEEVRAALSSPAVSVIDNGVPTNEDIDWFEGWVDKQAKSKSAFEAHDLWIMFQCIAMARAYKSQRAPDVPVIGEVIEEDDVEWDLRHVQERPDQANAYALNRIRQELARALPKMQKVDLDKMRQFGLGDASWEANFRYSYNRAIDDIKSQYGELYAGVK